MTFAIVPACGHSARMGRPKLALPLGDETVLGRVVAALRGGGVERVLVVVGPHVPELVPLAHATGADVLALTEPTADMRETVERGLARLEDRHAPQSEDWWALAPGDSPAITSEVVRQLLAAADESRSVVVPVFGGRRGHPVLLRWSHVSGIRAMPKERGVNAYLRRVAGETRELPVADAGILADLDTPEDYARTLSDRR
jgi:CTP:molybdopterin cytidylyltransferase MocA